MLTRFKFGNFDSKDLNLLVTSSGSRFNKNLLPPLINHTSELPEMDGQHYWGQTFGTREISLDVAFDNLKEEDWRLLSDLMSTTEPKELVLYDLPYKTYIVKLKDKPDFKYLCFKREDERIYKGEGVITFISFSPYGFIKNKYLVAAADNYKISPETLIKKYYNVENNDGKIWSGGYPTYEQVKNGELYFNGNNLIDFDKYWNDLPFWANSSKLLTTPTLCNDKQLIYCPQISRINNINMDKGFDGENVSIGSRLLCYNPGDKSMDFNLRFKFKEINDLNYQIRKFNVHKISIVDAVEILGLKCFDSSDEKYYKYGKKYLKMINEKTIVHNLDTYNVGELVNLESHPDFIYFIEPIPMEKLGDFIKLFYLQNYKKGYSGFDLEYAESVAQEYKVSLEKEKEEKGKIKIYYYYLRTYILEKYSTREIFDNINFDEFVIFYLWNLNEFSPSFNNGIELNLDNYPSYIPSNFLELEKTTNKEIFIDTNKSMIYYNEILEIDNSYKIEKIPLINTIKAGEFFKLETGWTMVEILPVVNDIENSKNWDRASDFFWGYSGENQEKQKLYDYIYNYALQQFETLYNRPYETIINEKIYDSFSNQMLYTLEIKRQLNFFELIQKSWALNKSSYIEGTIEEWFYYSSNYIWDLFPPAFYSNVEFIKEIKIDYTPEVF